MAEVLTERQLAKRFNLPLAWVKAQAMTGAIPHLRAGRRLLFNPVAVAEALAKLAAEYPRRDNLHG